MALTKVTYAMIEGAVANVLDFGAKGDGVTNDKDAINLAIASLSATGGSVYFPTGTYLIDGVGTDADGIVIASSNIKLFGDGASSVLKQSNNSKFVMVLNGSLAQLTDIEISDLYFNGPTARTVYTSAAEPKQYWPLLMVINVSGLRIHDNTFYAPTGDAIQIDQAYRSEGAPPYANTRHNVNIWIENNVIDGFDNNNRNGISIVDGNNVYIKNNTITRMANQYMPGSIDIEPNNYPYYIVQNIYVTNNNISDTKGVNGHLGYIISANSFNVASPPKNFVFDGNTLSGTGRPLFGICRADVALHLVITNNICKPSTGGSAFVFGFASSASYLNTAIISNNIFDSSSGTSSAILGIKDGSVEDVVKNIIFSNNYVLGNTTSATMIVGGSAINCSIKNNTFDTGQGVGVYVGTGGFTEVSKVSFIGNTFTNISASYISARLTTTTNANDGSCVWLNNTNTATPNGMNLCYFPAVACVDYGNAAPVSGYHSVGAICENSSPAVGSPKSWVCTVAGNPGTWVSTGNL